MLVEIDRFVGHGLIAIFWLRFRRRSIPVFPIAGDARRKRPRFRVDLAMLIEPLDVRIGLCGSFGHISWSEPLDVNLLHFPG